VDVTPSFFIGVSAVYSAGWPAGMDQTSPIDAAWAYYGPAPLDPAGVTGSTNMMSIGLGGNWMLRATGIPPGAPPNDCNENGIPDECDIGTEWGGFCVGPDCSTDYNLNGIPDECEEQPTGVAPPHPTKTTMNLIGSDSRKLR
jgi:hypothetical protein